MTARSFLEVPLMLTREEILDLVRQTMHELFEVEPQSVKLDTKLIDDLGLDSIDAIDLAARLEELTHKRLVEEQLRGLRTVGDVVTLIADMLKAMPRVPEGP
jgi:acyl carrier protein